MNGLNVFDRYRIAGRLSPRSGQHVREGSWGLSIFLRKQGDSPGQARSRRIIFQATTGSTGCVNQRDAGVGLRE